ncbi:Heavy metal-associated isoprenylated plant protein 7 [Orobanche minor]
MGEEKKEGAKKEEEKKNLLEEEVQEIVLKVDMHCEACARKVARALKGFQGVEDVRADYKANKVVVKAKGATDPIKVCQRIQKKSGRKVEITSPLPKLPQQNNTSNHNNKPQENKEEGKEKPREEKKEEPPAVITVVLKIRMHCEACAQALQKRIGKIKGVESVTADVNNDQVTVKGVVDPDKLVNDIHNKTGKQASIVKDEEKKKEEKKKKVDDKKEEKQEENKQVEEEDDEKTDIIKRFEYLPPKYYYTDYAYAPQFFSDENPNACSVM